jgi:hypothetical protein
LMFLFYTNMYGLVLWFLLKKKYAEYSIGIFGYITMAFLVLILMGHLTKPSPVLEGGERPDIKVFPFIFLALIFVAASSSIKLLHRWLTDNQRMNELEKITMQTELEQFLFNMLNNANVLTQKDPQKASQVLIKLSDLIRYQLIR